ncbi:MAG: hypothetical protein WCK51_08600 [Armatimonadota bacterium]
MAGRVVAALLIGASVVGCGSSHSDESVTISDGNGTKMTMSQADGAIQVEGNGVTASMGGKSTVTEEELGLPFYPGSSEKDGGSMKVETGDEKTCVSARTTSDEVAKVKAFYAEKFPALKFVGGAADGGSSEIGVGKLADDLEVSIQIVRAKDAKETSISVGTAKKAKK